MTSVAIHLNLLEANVNVTIGTLSKPSLCCSTFKGKVSPISIDIVFGQRANKKLVNDFKKNWGINLKWSNLVFFPGSVNLYIFPGSNLIISCYKALQDFQITTRKNIQVDWTWKKCQVESFYRYRLIHQTSSISNLSFSKD